MQSVDGSTVLSPVLPLVLHALLYLSMCLYNLVLPSALDPFFLRLWGFAGLGTVKTLTVVKRELVKTGSAYAREDIMASVVISVLTALEFSC